MAKRPGPRPSPNFKPLVYVQATPEEPYAGVTTLALFIKQSGILLYGSDEEARIRVCKEFFNTDALSTEMFLRLLMEREPQLHQHPSRVRLLWGASPFSIAPAAYLPPHQALHYARLVLDDGLFEEELLLSPLPAMEAQVVFTLPYPIQHILKEYVPHGQLAHVCETLVSMREEVEASEGTFLLVFDQQVLVALMRDHQLVLCNQYYVRAVADMAYFVQSARKTTGVSETSAVWVMGDLEGKLSELKKYLPQAEVPPFLGQALPKAAQAIPYWQFAYLRWAQLYAPESRGLMRQGSDH